jgi:transposase
MHETQEQEIIRRWRAGQSQRGIARDLGLSRKRVRRVVSQHEQGRESGVRHPDLPAPIRRRGSQVDAFETAIQQLLERYPQITVVRLREELQRLGYQGGYTVLRQRVKQLRTRPERAVVVRFETGPGIQAQMDWATYELEFTHEGRRRVNLFSYVLGYSRRQYLAFTEQQDLETTLRQHVRAFTHLNGAAATCLYDNMKVVVQRWEDDQPLYNSRFLAFATHYGFRPQACRPRRPQTKGKVERPFYYVETNLLNGRTFRSLEHLNEVTRWWLEHVADVRVHRETKKRPLDAHAEEQPHLLPLPAHPYDTAQVVYRVVNVDGFLVYRQGRYSVPWRYLSDVLPVRITEDQLVVYNRELEEVARHALLPLSQAGGERLDPAHRPPRDQQQQLETLRQRFAELSELGSRFLEGLLAKQRCGKHQAQRVWALLRTYHRADVLAALERAVRYQAYSLASLERILAAQATPKAPWASLSEDQQQWLRDLAETDSPPARPSREYQSLLFDEDPTDAPPPSADDHPPTRDDQPPPAATP